MQQTWIIIFYLIQTHSYTSQGRFICRSFVVVDVSLLFGTQQQHGWAAFLAASASVQS